MPATTPSRPSWFPFALTLGAGLLLSSCFDAPIRETLRLRFLPDGAVVLASRVEISPENEATSLPLRRRLAEARRVLAEGSDPWSQRFAALTPAAERAAWEKELGELTRVSRGAIVTEPEDLSRFFADTGVQVTYLTRPEDRLAELTMTPGASTRATYRQRRDMDAVLASWSEDLAAYFAAAGTVYDYLDQHPDRERVVLGALFRDLLPEKKAPGEPTPDEKRLLDRLDAAMSRVLEVLQTGEGEAYSLDEISHLVYDPFPAKLEIALPAPAREVEGFEKTPAGTLTVRGCGFWDALRSLEGRWLAPDLVSVYAAVLREDHKLDLDAFLSQPRRVGGTPSAPEVREALVQALTPSRTYRAAWEIRPESDPPADLWAGFEAP